MSSWGTFRRAGLAAVAVSALGATALVACDVPGPTFVVNTTTDGVDANPGDGVCEVTPHAGDCTLRAAIMETNAEPTSTTGLNTIDIGDGNTYVLTIPGVGENGDATGDLDVTDSLQINGQSTIDGNSLDRVFHILSGQFFMDGATIRNGRAITSDPATSIGGGMLVEPGVRVALANVTMTDNTAFEGGAIYSSGDTRATASHLMNNQAVGRVRSDGVILFARGGAVRTAAGSLGLFSTTVANNSIGTAGDGAGISAQSPVLVQSSTISGNLASLPGAFASAISVLGHSGIVIVVESTISNNAGPAVVSTTASGGTSQGVTILNSTLADNSGNVISPSSAVTIGGVAIQTNATACQSVPIDQGYNVVSDSSCGLSAVGDVQGLSPLVGPVADNGGPTLTNLPFKNSPMLHQIPSGTVNLCDSGQPVDQRGVARPVNGFCNIGSVEGNSPKNGITVTPPH